MSSSLPAFGMHRRFLIKGACAGAAAMCCLPGRPAFGKSKGSVKKACRPGDVQLMSPRFAISKSSNGRTFTYSWGHLHSITGSFHRIEISFEKHNNLTEGQMMRKLVNRMSHRESDQHYLTMATTAPYRRTFLRPLVQGIMQAADALEDHPVPLILSLVQSIAYRCEDGYQSWPVECLLQLHADCSDASVCAAALLEELHWLQRKEVDWDRVPLWVFLQNEQERHMAIAVRLPDRHAIKDGFFIMDRGRKYFVAETTWTGWRIGELPDELNQPKVLARRL